MVGNGTNRQLDLSEQARVCDATAPVACDLIQNVSLNYTEPTYCVTEGIIGNFNAPNKLDR